MREPSRYDGRRAVADVAAALAFGGRGGEQQLFVGEPAQQPLMPGAGAAVAHQAGDLDLVHRIDHRGRGAGAAERVADVGDLGDARRLRRRSSRGTATPSRRSARAAAMASCGKPRIAVDRRGMLPGNGGDLVGARHAIGGAGNAQAACRGENAARGTVAPFERLDRLLEPSRFARSSMSSRWKWPPLAFDAIVAPQLAQNS